MITDYYFSDLGELKTHSELAGEEIHETKHNVSVGINGHRSF